MHQITKRLLSIFAVATLFAAGIHGAVAQKAANDAALLSTEPLQIKLVRSKVGTEGGREVMLSAAVAQPGDIIEEVATYINTSKVALRSVEATLPVPVNTELVMASVKPANARASTDGINFSKIPLTRKVRQANGVEVEQPVALSEYRYLRWYPGVISPDKPLSFSARFKVANSLAAASAAVK